MKILSIEQVAQNLSTTTDSEVAQWAYKNQFLKGKYVAVGAKLDYYITVEALKEYHSITILDEWELQGLEEESEEQINAKKARRKEILASKISLDEAYEICLKLYKDSLVEKIYVKPVVLLGKALFVQATFRAVKNNKDENFGLYSGHTDCHYEPFWKVFQEEELYGDLSLMDSKVKELGFIPVRPDFYQYGTAHVEEIKSQLPEEWIEIYNAYL